MGKTLRNKNRETLLTNQYLKRRLPSQEAAECLRAIRTSYGNLLAGEISLDGAARDECPSVSAHLAFAHGSLTSVVKDARPLFKDDVNRVRAGMRLAQFNLNADVYGKRLLPHPSMVNKSYRALVGHAIQSIEVERQHHSSSIKQALGEMAVLLLAQRYALREEIAEEWLPLQSLLSEDRGESYPKDAGTFTWDMNIFAPAENKGGPLIRVHALKVMTGADDRIHRGPTICIQPDLALEPHEKFIPEKIITACGTELVYPGDSARFTGELDIRTEQFLSSIETSEA